MKEVIKILGYDPGLTTIAWVLCTYNTKTGILAISRTGEICGDKTILKVKEQQAIYPSSFLKLLQLEEEVKRLCTLKPDYVVCEDFFYQFGRHKAYAILALCIHQIRLATKESLGLPVTLIPTKRAKQLLAGSGGASKEDVQEAIRVSNDIVFETIHEQIKNAEDIVVNENTNRTINIDELSHHVCDAIAVIYAFIKESLLALEN